MRPSVMAIALATTRIAGPIRDCCVGVRAHPNQNIRLQFLPQQPRRLRIAILHPKHLLPGQFRPGRLRILNAHFARVVKIAHHRRFQHVVIGRCWSPAHPPARGSAAIDRLRISLERPVHKHHDARTPMIHIRLHKRLFILNRLRRRCCPRTTRRGSGSTRRTLWRLLTIILRPRRPIRRQRLLHRHRLIRILIRRTRHSHPLHRLVITTTHSSAAATKTVIPIKDFSIVFLLKITGFEGGKIEKHPCLTPSYLRLVSPERSVFSPAHPQNNAI